MSKLITEKRINSEIGNYLISNSRDFEFKLNAKPFNVGCENLHKGIKSTFFGYFKEPIEYVGRIGNEAYFLLGKSDDDLFNNGTYYYDCIYIIGSNRIVKKFTNNSARDFFLCYNGVHFYWK